ncbi:MAG: J domain-containing protein [Myxococcota bacterium]|nr:J domain-containing protein [Myxococcota bacterium]
MHRGSIGDQPWGWTLGALGLAERTAEVVLRADDKVHRIRFERGLVVGADSPLAVDSVTRVALTNHFIASIQVNEIKRCLAVAPSLDEVDVLAVAAHLDPETKQKLRIRLLTQRAARTFAVDRGDFEIEDCSPTPGAPASVDIRAVIFAGARMNLSEDRLRFGLRKFGSRFVLKRGAAETLGHFQFTPKEQPLLETLRSPTSLAELEASHREIDPRAVQSVVYSLASCNALTELDLSSVNVPIESDLAIPSAPPPRAASVRSMQPRETSPPDPFDDLEMAQGTPGPDAVFEGPLTRAITALELEMFKLAPETFDEQSTMVRKESAVPMAIEGGDLTVPAQKARSMIETFKTGRATTVRPNALKAHEVLALIKERTALVSRGGDHFALLGVKLGAPIEEIHAAYVELSRNLGTKRLAELGIADKGLRAAGLLAQIGIAFTVLTDRIRRAEYVASLHEQAAKAEKASRRPR